MATAAPTVRQWRRFVDDARQQLVRATRLLGLHPPGAATWHGDTVAELRAVVQHLQEAERRAQMSTLGTAARCSTSASPGAGEAGSTGTPATNAAGTHLTVQSGDGGDEVGSAGVVECPEDANHSVPAASLPRHMIRVHGKPLRRDPSPPRSSAWFYEHAPLARRVSSSQHVADDTDVAVAADGSLVADARSGGSDTADLWSPDRSFEDVCRHVQLWTVIPAAFARAHVPHQESDGLTVWLASCMVKMGLEADPDLIEYTVSLLMHPDNNHPDVVVAEIEEFIGPQARALVLALWKHLAIERLRAVKRRGRDDAAHPAGAAIGSSASPDDGMRPAVSLSQRKPERVRDFRRRTHSYRAKRTHLTKRTPRQLMRDSIAHIMRAAGVPDDMLGFAPTVDPTQRDTVEERVRRLDFADVVQLQHPLNARPPCPAHELHDERRRRERRRTRRSRSRSPPRRHRHTEYQAPGSTRGNSGHRRGEGPRDDRTRRHRSRSRTRRHRSRSRTRDRSHSRSRTRRRSRRRGRSHSR